MMPFPLQLILPSPKIGYCNFNAHVVPASLVDHEPGLSYPPRKMWWNYFKKDTKLHVQIQPFSVKPNGCISFYISNFKSADWNPEHSYAAVLPCGTYSEVILCKVNLNQEHVIFDYDPAIRLMTCDEQYELVNQLRPVNGPETIDFVIFTIIATVLMVVVCSVFK